MPHPRCPRFGFCGGCALQDVPYAEQLRAKREKVSRLLEVPQEEVEVHSGREFAYRNRMDFAFHPGGLGLRERNRWDRMVDVPYCHISRQRLNRLLREVRAHFPAPVDAFEPRSQTGTFKYAVIRAPTLSSSVSFILNQDSPGVRKAEEAVEDFAPGSTADSVLLGYVPKKRDQSISQDYRVVKGEEYLEERLAGGVFRFHVMGFFQTNSAMADRLVRYVRGLFSDGKGGTLLDLYSGVGVFGIACSRLFDQVVMVESHPQSVEAARENVRLNRAGNVEAVLLDAGGIPELHLEPGGLHALVDPPRAGMHPKALRRLVDLGPERVVYVSCKPERLAQEMPVFRRAGYRMTSCALFDLFPQTRHCEVVVEMARG
ncbi:MAG: 23S rRNA (uracil(1939)-C(5))-methyltransferase RlmD [Euryarchaeota archaeon]|nr:23S rRNA (uracil(1939)-C(5))-methyltransferase RlmD [Euryarchaeota archaeon]